VDLIHTLAYKGMGVFPGYGANLPTQLWIAARYLESVSLLLAPLFLKRPLNPYLALGSYALAAVMLLLAIFGGVFPACFIEGTGLTRFKVGSEYLICLILAGALIFLLKNRREFHPRVVSLLGWSIVLTIAQELSFTLYVDVYGLFNMIGHYLKILSFYLIYKAIIETGLVRPYDVLFRNLKLSKEQVEAANRELQAFSYSASHDLRAPLRSIDGFSRILLEEYTGQLDFQGRLYLSRIRESVERMGDLIDALLALSRVSRAEMRREEVDLSALARAAAQDLRRSEPDRPVEFHLTEGLKANGDPALLRALLQNLLGNAWKFTGKQARGVIEFGVQPPSHDGSVFFVRDNGVGFDMQHAAKLFSPFHRLHCPTDFPGAGIGLATVQRIIQRHGGRVWAEAAPGQGATFYFTLGR
jgi:signal transduction histidine kinase